MTTLNDLLLAAGAVLAADGIPLHYGSQQAEYHAALNQAVVMERSHEGRLELAGRDRLDLIQRISTNDVLHLALHEGRPTIFTNPNGRILDRVTLHNRGETALLLTEPGRGAAVAAYLRGQIFFNDDVQVNDLAPASRLFTLHGPQADPVAEALVPGAASVPPGWGTAGEIAGAFVFMARRKPLSGTHWALIVPEDNAAAVWSHIRQIGAPWGLIPAGSLVYNALRIRAGRPGVGRELSPDYIPLEAGLWDEVSFNKGCYTGQEIIARMESRNKLAKTLVSVRLMSWAEAPATILHEGKPVGTLTSSVTAPDGVIWGLGFIKPGLAASGLSILVGAGVPGEIIAPAGAQPPAQTAG